jgi:pyruvate formate lyase activating enzyme
LKEALFYEKLNTNKVQCHLCAHHCVIPNNKRGICGVRENRSGILYSLVYGKSIAENVDPIEKKPLFHFLPGSNSFSIATAGCNFRCLHCQNYDISQMPRTRDVIIGKTLSPEDIVALAKQTGCKSISYTYTEPTIYFEYAYDIAKRASQEGLKNVFVTNGYITDGPLRKISPYLDAANIDLKAFTEGFYKKICGARLQPVLDAIRLYRELEIWIELTTLIIPTHNDSQHELEQIASFIRELGPDIPWHITAYHPTYRLTDQPRTPVKTLIQAREIGLRMGLRYVYIGNVPEERGENTYCYNCGELLIERCGFSVRKNRLRSGHCPECRVQIAGVVSQEG